MANTTNCELILIRHAKAELGTVGVSDSKRALTESGINSFHNILPELKEHLQSTDTLQIYSSDLLRAVQTAKIIGRYLEINQIIQQDWIADGEFAGLENALKNIKPPERLIIVGHEPYLSAWAKRLTGLEIPFRKGCAVAFNILSTEPLQAEIKWIILQETTDPHGLLIAESRSYVTEARKIFRFQIQEIFNNFQQFIARPDDPDTTHQFRVKIRAFRSYLSFSKEQIDEEQYAFIQQKLRQMAQQFGYLREIDVLKNQWDDFIEKHISIIGKPKELTALLRKERKRELTKILKQTKTILSDIFEIWMWVENAIGVDKEETKTGEAFMSFEKYTQKRLKNWQKKTKDYFDAIDLSHIESVHTLRIQSKKLRYVLSLVEPFVTFKIPVSSKIFRSFQDLLGDYCDTDRNRHILNVLGPKSENVDLRYEIGLFSGYQLRVAEEKLAEIKKFKQILVK